MFNFKVSRLSHSFLTFQDFFAKSNYRWNALYDTPYQKNTNDANVFTSPNGSPIAPDSVNDALKQILEHAVVYEVNRNTPQILRRRIVRPMFVKNTCDLICFAFDQLFMQRILFSYNT